MARGSRRSNRSGSGQRGGNQRNGARRSGAPRSGARRSAAHDQRRVTWGRRIGLLGGLIVAGAGVVFAGQALRSGADAPPSPTMSSLGSPSSAPTASRDVGLPPAPILDQPASTPTAEQAITVSGRLQQALPAGSGPYRLRIYVNDRLQRDVRIARHELEFRVGGVPLARGENTIRAAVAGSWGETLHSPAVVVERDDEPPEIVVLEPANGAVLFDEAATIRGRTEPGAVVTALNQARSSMSTALVDAEGAFTLVVLLTLGVNDIELTSRDPAGNAGRQAIGLELRESSAAVAIELSSDSFELARLPAAVDVIARLSGEDGQPLDGVEVVFSISAPGQMTATYTTVGSRGVASWLNIPLPREGAERGRGLVTVLATLADGQELRASASFTFR